MMVGGANVLMHSNPGVLSTRSSEISLGQDSGSSASFPVFEDNKSESSQTSSSRSESSRALLGRSRDNSLACSFPSLSRQPSLDSTAALMAANPTGARSKFVTTPSPHSMKGIITVTNPSPTVNTKEAMAVMQQLWSNPVGVDDADPQPLPQPKSTFQIYTDENYAEPNPAVPFPIFNDFQAAPAPTAPFTIFSDAAAPQNTKNQLANRKSLVAQYNILSDKENSPVQTDEVDSNENDPPCGYSQPY